MIITLKSVPTRLSQSPKTKSVSRRAKIPILLFLLLPVMLHAQGGTITTICGNGVNALAGDGGPAMTAETRNPFLGIFDRFGNYYFTEFGIDIVRKIDAAGIITKVAGNGTSGYSGDGMPATTAQLNQITCLCADTIGNLYISDGYNARVRKVDVSTGIITTVAGNGVAYYSGGGVPATDMGIYIPQGICMDPFGNLYISTSDHLILKVNTGGIISTYAGSMIYPGYGGDGGPATAATLGSSAQLVSDKYGNIYMASNTIREINASTGIISTLAGDTAVTGFSGDGGPATAALLHNPSSLAITHSGLLYINDMQNYRIRKIDAHGIITTVAGKGIAGFFGDGGKDTAAEFNWVEGIAFDSCDNMYIDDMYNHRIRKITYPILPDTATLSAPPLAAVGGSVTVTATLKNAGTKYSIQWMNHGVLFATTTVPSVTYTKTMVVDLISAKVIPTACYDSVMSDTVMVTQTTEGIGLPASSLVNIYPIPATDILHIDYPVTEAGAPATAAYYRLFSVVGGAVQHGPIARGDNQVSIKDLPYGVYILEITDCVAGKRITNKIIKQ